MLATVYSANSMVLFHKLRLHVILLVSQLVLGICSDIHVTLLLMSNIVYITKCHQNWLYKLYQVVVRSCFKGVWAIGRLTESCGPRSKDGYCHKWKQYHLACGFVKYCTTRLLIIVCKPEPVLSYYSTNCKDIMRLKTCRLV